MLNMKAILGLLGILAVCLFVSCDALAQQDGIVIHTVWKGHPKVLNVHLTGAPPNAEIDVTVVRISDNNVLDPNGAPPGNADPEGNWPGENAGGEVGYEETANDGGGTRYVVKVIVNGQTGPIKGTTKPYTFFEAVLKFLTFGLFVDADTDGGKNRIDAVDNSVRADFRALRRNFQRGAA